MNARQFRALFASNNERWGTPGDVFGWLQLIFQFMVDVCADAENHKLARHFTPELDGLRQDWTTARNSVWFCNPPYGRKVIDRWCAKGRNSAMIAGMGALLVPARVDSTWWRHLVLSEDGNAGKLLASGYHEESRVLWLQREGLVTGIFYFDHRIDFVKPLDHDESVGDSDSAPFPSALVIQINPRMRPRVLPASSVTFEKRGEQPYTGPNLLAGYGRLHGGTFR